MRLAGLVGLLAMLCAPARADTPDQNAVQAVLDAFVDNFNGGRIDRVCDIFATDLVYDYRGISPNRTYQEICDGLHATLADTTRRYRYALDRREILVFGDIAVVRVVWDVTLTIGGSGKPIKNQEYSMDLFRRQRDTWKLFRFNAYEAE